MILIMQPICSDLVHAHLSSTNHVTQEGHRGNQLVDSCAAPSARTSEPGTAIDGRLVLGHTSTDQLTIQAPVSLHPANRSDLIMSNPSRTFLPQRQPHVRRVTVTAAVDLPRPKPVGTVLSTPAPGFTPHPLQTDLDGATLPSTLPACPDLGADRVAQRNLTPSLRFTPQMTSAVVRPEHAPIRRMPGAGSWGNPQWRQCLGI